MNLKQTYEGLKKLPHNKADEQVDVFLNLLKNDTPFAFARFNDGEMMGINNIGAKVARGDQVVNESLHKALKKSIQHVQKNYYVGIPCSSCFPKYYNLAKGLVKQENKFVLNAVALTNRNWSKFIAEAPEAFGDKKILWISGDDQNLNFLRDNMGLNIISQISVDRVNSWRFYSQLLLTYKNTIKDDEPDIVMISLGPTARVMAQQLFAEDDKKTFIDIGSTYDPFTRNVWHNCHKGWLETGFNKTKNCKVCN